MSLSPFIKRLYDLLPFKKQLFSLLRHLPVPEKIYQHLHFKGVINVKLNNRSFKIRHYGYQLENEIFWKGVGAGWEKVSMQLWIELCKQSEVIIDVGANTGIYSLVAECVNPDASIYAFEPVPRVYNKLVQNVELNRFHVRCFETALSDKNGHASFFDPMTEHVYSVSVNKNMSPGENTVETRVKTKTLGTFILEQHLSRIDLMKIDVETHEAEVLSGMGDYLRLFQPALLIEILNDEIGHKIQQLVSDCGYLYYNIDEVNAPRLVQTIGKSDYYNYLLCTKTVAKKLNLQVPFEN